MGFLSGVTDIYVFLGYDAASLDSRLHTFQDDVFVSTSMSLDISTV